MGFLLYEYEINGSKENIWHYYTEIKRKNIRYFYQIIFCRFGENNGTLEFVRRRKHFPCISDKI